ncbi:ribonuclease III domain-containing protein [Mycena vulgaris]|nr:ribonuclease III domain-containing protein [Mycena vulgaris]
MALLQVYLDSVKHTSSHRLPLAALSPHLFRQATNSVKHSTENNDLLEFIGDRAINLACALLVDKEKVCPDQQIFVGRKLANNDTLARLAYWLHLDKYAALSQEDAHAIKSWSPRRKRDGPPKVLADLFEAFVGAYCLERGWSALLSWLQPFFEPLVKIATEDFLRCHRDTCKAPFYVSNWWRHRGGGSISQRMYQKLLQFFDRKQGSLTSKGRVAVEAIPLSTKFIFSADGELMNDCDRVEVAHHLISQWICNVYVSMFPENRHAIVGATHLATTITNLVISDVSLGFIASLFSLSSYFDVEDPDFNSTRPVRWALPLDPAASAREAAYRTKLSLAFQAAVGWFYFSDPQAAQDWGMRFFTPIVTESYHVLVQSPCYQPVLPSTPRPRQPMRTMTNLQRPVHIEQRCYS